MTSSMLEDALARYWGYTAFRPLQRLVGEGSDDFLALREIFLSAIRGHAL